MWRMGAPIRGAYLKVWFNFSQRSRELEIRYTARWLDPGAASRGRVRDMLRSESSLREKHCANRGRRLPRVNDKGSR
jgi:hypothetical protein